MKRFAFACVILTFVMLLVGCATQTRTWESPKQELIVGLADDLTGKMYKSIWGISPYKTQIYEPLVYTDHNLNIKPCLATSWERIDENTWRFKLRKGVKFHDGTKFTAENVKFSFDRLLELFPATPTWLHINQDSVKIIDEYTVEIRTTRPCAEYPAIIAHPMVAAMGYPVKEGTPCGTGPFKVEKVIPQREIILVRNEDYWDQERKPKLDKIIFKYIPDHDTRVMALLSGEVDVIYPVQPSSVAEIEKHPNYKISQTVGPRVDLLRFNSGGDQPYDKLKDIRLRKAIAHAVNKKAIIENVLRGFGIPANTNIAPMIPWSTNDDLKGYPYDLDKAKAYLEQAGWIDADGDGILEKNGEKLKLDLILTNSVPYHVSLGEVLQSQLRKVGIDLQLKILESAAVNELAKNGKYDMIIKNLGTKSAAADYLLWEQYHSAAVKMHGWVHMNLKPEVSKHLDELLDFGLSSMKPREERYKAWKEAQKIVFDEELIDLPLLFQVHVIGFKKEVQGVKLHPLEDWLEWHNVHISG